nr:putative RNA-directed DNA polymerase, eukaryota, reverse transcriptase zinc-binding domain protein [Tanacetum cinerariifolium]
MAFDSLRWDYLDAIMEQLGLGLFKGASIGHGSLNVSHLLYADDAIFVGECKLLCVNVPDEEISNTALVLGCGVEKFPMMYLRVHVGSNMCRCGYWNCIVQKFESKMSRWKARILSVRGRLSLIKAVLGSISWASKKQTCLIDSTMENEFVALAAAGKEAEWLKNLIYEIPL